METLDLIFQVLKFEQVAELLKGPLERAAGQGNRGLAQKLLQAGAQIGDALHQAVRGGHEEMVNDLLENGASFGTKSTRYGRTPLHTAAQVDKQEMVQLLMIKGADKDALDIYGWTPLYTSAYYGSEAATLALLAGGADASIRCGFFKRSVTSAAAEQGHVDTLRAVLTKGEDANYVDTEQHTALHAAARKNQAEAIDVLLEAGANIDAQDGEGKTPLHHACNWLSLAALDALLKHGARVNAAKPDSGTPLHYAAALAGREGAAEVVDLLLRSGADETIVDIEGNAAVDVLAEAVEEAAIEGEIERVYQLLANAPADRAWRRRGYLVLCRAHPGRVQQAHKTSGASAGMSRRTCSRVKRRRPESSRCNDGVRRTAADEGGGVDWACVVARVLELQEEGIFRTIVGYL